VKAFALSLAAAAAQSANSHAASFDCVRATSATERTVCASPRLSQLDEHLGRYYAAARTALKDAAPCLRADQQQWLRNRDQCKDAGCLESAYLDRLAELDPLQPGATALEEELPRRPGLAWIIAPAADRVAAPANPAATPGEFSGVLLDEVATGDGFVVRSTSGERRLLAMLMFLEPETAGRLASLARDPGTTVVARGHTAGEGARKYFEPSRCTFIYRVDAPADGRPLGDPTRAPAGFKPHQLAFATPKDGVARAQFRSTPFYAVILKTLARCAANEPERLSVQALFPANKVFSTRFGCDEPEENITYTNVDANFGFLAVFGGPTEADAREVLRKVQAAGGFPGANVRRMQAVLVYP
jgi:uncharacterized protein